MNYKKEQAAFKQILQSNHNNRYEAVKKIGHDARRISERSSNILSHSEAITYRLLGELPKDIDFRKAVKSRLSYKYNLISSVLDHVMDKQIIDCVKKSINKSIRMHNLTYIYGGVKSKYTKQRIRVLTNIIWYQLYSYRKDQ